MLDDSEILALSNNDGVSVHAGFPNPAADRRRDNQAPRLGLDLNQLLMRHPSATFLFRIAGHHWSDQGIFDGDIAVIDRSRQANSQALIIAWQDSGYIICRQPQLTKHETPWGVITAVIHQFEA